MDVTVLGSGDAVGVPAPLCDCEYCVTSQRRRRPGVLVETDRATVALDVGPDLAEQLHAVGVSSVDAFFVTHFHYDHVGGLHELNHAAMGFDAHVGIEGGYMEPAAFDESEKSHDPEFAVYLSETALDHLRESAPHLRDHLALRTIDHGAGVEVGDVRVVPFPVEHARPTFDTLGFAVYCAGAKIVYAPDLRTFGAGSEYEGADVLFVEGAALFRVFGHGEEDELGEAIAAADADRTVLLNLNEHLQRMTTAGLGTAAAADGYELALDFERYEI